MKADLRTRIAELVDNAQQMERVPGEVISELIIDGLGLGDSLPQELRAAADTMDKLCAQEGWDTCTFGPLGLRAIADQVEAEDRAKAEQDAMVDELARTIALASHPDLQWPDDFDLAYRKGVALKVFERFEITRREGGSDG